MKDLRNYTLTIAFSFLLVNACFSQSNYDVKSSDLKIQGSSSLHDWESEVTKTEWTGYITTEDNKGVEVKQVEIKVPVTNIQSEHGRIMDSKTYEAFDYEKNPNIYFKTTAGKTFALTANAPSKVSGSLTMAGVTRPAELTVTTRINADGTIQFSGSQKIKMTDFGMDPPTALMGTIKVGDEVTVTFNLVVTPKINAGHQTNGN